MAGKNIDLDSLDLDRGLDLEDVERMFDDDLAESKPSKITEFVTSFKDSFADKMKVQHIARTFLKNALPDGFARVFGVYDDLSRAADEIVDEVERKVPNDLLTLTKTAEANLGKLKGRISDPLYDRIDKNLKERATRYRDNRASLIDRSLVRKRNQAQQDEDTIRQALDHNSTVQQYQLSHTERQNERRFNIERTERAMRDRIEKGRFKLEAKAYTGMTTALDRLVGYNEQVNYVYQQRSMEIQFRSFMKLRDILDTLENQTALHNAGYTALVRNTGLPEGRKIELENLTVFGSNYKKAAGGLFGSGLSDLNMPGSKGLPTFLATFSREVQRKISRPLIDMIQKSAGLADGAGLLDLVLNNKERAAGEAASSLADYLITDVGIPYLGRKVKPNVNRLLAVHGQGRQYQLDYILDNVPSMARDFVNSPTGDNFYLDAIKSMLAPHIPTFSLDDKLEGGYKNIQRPANFNQMTQRAIVEVMPGYLSRILGELTMLRTGSETNNLVTFDYTKGEFTGQHTAKSRIAQSVVTRKNTAAISNAVSNVIRMIDPGGQLSPDARRVLAERLVADGATGKRFNPESLIRKFSYSDANPATVAEIIALLKNSYEFNRDGKLKANASNFKLRQKMSEQYLYMRDSVRDPGNEIRRLVSSGNTDILRQLGIIDTDGNSDKINYKTLWKMMLSDLPEHQEKEDSSWSWDSGDIESDNFIGPHLPGTLGKMFNKFSKNKYTKQWTDEELAANLKRYEELRRKLNKPKPAKTTPKTNVEETFSAATQSRILGPNTTLIDIQTESLKVQKDILNALRGTSSNKVNGLNTKVGVIDRALSEYAKVNTVNDPFGKVETLHTLNTKNVFTSTELFSGKYIDTKTRKMVFNFSDITSPVVDQWGQTVISAIDLQAGIKDSHDRTVKQLNTDKAEQLINKALNLKHLYTEAKGDPSYRKAMDLYVPGKTVPVIYGKHLEEGLYYSGTTGKPITSIDEIDGPVLDSNGETVVTDKEAMSGLYNALGELIIDATGVRDNLGYKVAKQVGSDVSKPFKNKMVTGYLGMAGSYYKALGTGTTTQKIFRGLGLLAKASFKLSKDVLTMGVVHDAYLAGNPEPVLTVTKLRQGDYFKTKRFYTDQYSSNLPIPITRWEDVTATVYDRDGNVQVEAENLKFLVNADGTKHQIAKYTGIMGTIRRATVTNIKMFAQWTGRGYLKATKAYYRWLGKKVGKIGGWFSKKLANYVGEKPEELTAQSSVAQVSILESINDRLAELSPEQHRPGSWQEKAANAIKDKAAKVTANGSERLGEKTLVGSLLGGLANLLKPDRGSDDNSEDEGDDGDTIIGGGWWGRNKEQRERNRNKKANKGSKLKRLRDLAKADRLSRVGWGGRILGQASRLLMNPYVAGAAVVGAGAYWMYGRIKDTSGDFKNLRYLQYGITSTGEQLDINKLEALIDKNTIRSATPEINIPAASVPDILDTFGIDRDSEEDVIRFSRWFTGRFKPVFTKWIAGLHQLGQRTPIQDIDGSLGEQFKGDLLSLVKFPYSGDTPYLFNVNPMDSDEPLPDLTEQIQETFERLGKLYKVSEATLVKQRTDAAKLQTTVQQKVQATADRAANPRTAGIVPLNPTKPIAMAYNQIDSKVMPLVYAKLPENKLTALQSIRMRAYGLGTLDKAQVIALLSLEDRMGLGLYLDINNGERSVNYRGMSEDLLLDAGGLFGYNLASYDKRRTQFVNWFYNRFVPVFYQYLNSSNTRDFTQLSKVEGKLKPQQLVLVSNAIIGTTNDQKESIWNVDTIFDNKIPLSELKSYAELELKQLKTQVDSGEYESPLMKASDQRSRSTGMESEQSFLTRVNNRVTAIKDTVVETAKAGVSAVGDYYTQTKDAVKYSLGVQGAQQAVGSTFSNVTKGNGGSWEKVPMPTANKSAAAARKTLSVVSEMTGVPLELLMIFCSIESGFDYLAKNPDSSASGWFQFINGTWDGELAKHAKKYGLPPDTADRRLRLDPRINGLMGGEFLKSNFLGLKKSLGRDPSDTDMYIAHFMGLGGARQFLKADQSVYANRVFPDQAASNRRLFYMPNGTPRTIGQLYTYFDGLVAQHRGVAGGSVASQEPGVTVKDIPTAGVDQNNEAITEGTKETTTENAGISSAVNATTAPSVSETVTAPAANTSATGTQPVGSTKVSYNPSEPNPQTAATSPTDSSVSDTSVPTQRMQTDDRLLNVQIESLKIQQSIHEINKQMLERMSIAPTTVPNVSNNEPANTQRTASNNTARPAGNLPLPVSMA